VSCDVIKTARATETTCDTLLQRQLRRLSWKETLLSHGRRAAITRVTSFAACKLAMRKCLIHFFPRACIVVCSRHIKENVVRKLDELLGKSSDVRRQLLDALFGSSGLVSLDNVVAFDNAVDKLRAPTGLMTNAPAEFQQYFQRRLVQLMRDNCAAGRSTWTNNNCESMNHVLKQGVQWRRNQLPELIDKLRSLVKGQEADADRAICGRGDFSLRPE